MTITNEIREAKAYRASLITRLEMKGLSDLEDKTLDELEALEEIEASIIETIRFENESCKQGISMSDAYEQAKNQGVTISFEEYKKRFREIEETHPCPSFVW